MILDKPYHQVITVKKIALLAFLPAQEEDFQQWNEVCALVDFLHHDFGDHIRIIRLKKIAHPEVLQSFQITQTPSFVLLHTGSEVWRHAGLVEEEKIRQEIQQILKA